MAQNVGEIFASLELDNAEFERKMAQSEKMFRTLGTTATRSTTDIRSTSRQAASGIDIITASSGRAETAARGIQVNTTLQADARRAANGFDTLGTSARNAARDVEQATSRSGRDAGEGAGEGFSGGFGSKLKGLSSAGGPIAAGLMGVAALGLAAGAVLAKAIADGMERDAQLDVLQARLGINEDTARKIGVAAGQSYSSGWGESVEANMEATRMAIQSGILTGEEDTGTFKATIDGLNTVSTLLDTEVSESVRAVSALMSNGLAANATEAFDLIAKAGEGSANKAGDLIDSVSEYSSGWKNAGLSAEFALSLIKQSTDNGADNSDRAADSLREFGRRVTEEGDTIVSTIDGIGLSGQDMYDAFKRGGPDAEAAFDAVFDKIRSIEDPVERNTAAMALLGDTSGDFIGTLSSWDPSAAMRAFGDVEGAASKAGDTMSGNTAASFESAKRSVEMSVDDIKLALAQGLTPALSDVANWVSTHKPEIIGFFTDMVDAGFTTLDGILAFASGSLRGFGALSDGISEWSGSGMSALGKFAQGLGDVLSLIPGMQGTGDALSAVGSGLQTMSESLAGAGDKARGYADTIDETIRPALQGIGEDVVRAGQNAESSARLMQALGTAVVQDIPDSKSIVIDSNTPEQKTALEQLGLTVRELPNGTFVVTANTTEGQTVIDNFVLGNDGKTITMNVRTQALNPMPGVTIPQAGGGRSYDGTIVGGLANRADGGIDNLPNQARVQRGQLVQWAEPETGGESFIPWAPSKRARSTDILAQTASAFGLSLVKMADGGMTGPAVNKEAAIAYAKSHDDEPYVYGALDCSGYQSGIYNELTGKSVRFTTDSDFAALGFVPGYDPNGYSIGTNGGVGMNGHMVGNLYGTNVESGGDGIQYGGSAQNPTDFPMVWHLPQATETGDDPSSERLTDTGGATPADTVTLGTASNGIELATDGQRVFVTNWPGKAASDERQPKARLGVSFFADGGTVGGSGNTDSVPAMLTPDEEVTRQPMARKYRGLLKLIDRDAVPGFSSGGTVGGFGGVGMGGGSGEHIGSWKVAQAAPAGDVPLSSPPGEAGAAVLAANAFKALAAGVGLAMTAASGFDADGKFTGQFDTSTNSPAVVEAAAQRQTELLAEILDALKEGTPVDVQVDVDTDNGRANLAFLSTGV